MFGHFTMVLASYWDHFRDHFHRILESFLEHFWISLGLFCTNLCEFRYNFGNILSITCLPRFLTFLHKVAAVILLCFSHCVVSLTMWFWDLFWIILARFWHQCGIISRRFWVQLGIILGWFLHQFKIILKWFGDQFRIILGWFWNQFNIDLKRFWDQFRIILEWFWGSIWDHFGMIFIPI